MAIGLVIEAVPPTSLQRRHHQHELPARALGAGRRQVVQVLVVQELHAHGDQRQDVDRVGAGAVERVLAQVADAVAAEQRDATLLEPGRHLVVESGRAGSAVPGAERLASGVAPGSHQQDVAGLDPQPGRCLGRFKLRDGDRVVRLQPVDASWRGTSSRMPRDTMPSWPMVIAFARAPIEVTIAIGSAVVHLPLPEEMAERVQVRVGQAVRRDRQVVRGRGEVDAVRRRRRRAPSKWLAGEVFSASPTVLIGWAH